MGEKDQDEPPSICNLLKPELNEIGPTDFPLKSNASLVFRKHSFNQLLIVLSLFDILFILVSVPVYSFSLFNLLVGNQVG